MAFALFGIDAIFPVYASQQFTTSDSANAVNIAKSIGSTLTGMYNSDGMTNKINLPMTSKTKITTVDGSKSGMANITCGENATAIFMRVTYSGTSDITINIDLDTNLDGAYDNSYTFPGISGITTTGVAVCNANTFKNCNYYNWAYSSGTVGLTPVSPQQVTNVFCINSSCGSKSASYQQEILGDISGSVSASVQASNSNLIIAKTITNNFESDVYGQNYTNCTNSKKDAIYSGGSDDSALKSLGSSAMSSDPTGAMGVINGTMINQQKNPTSSADKADIIMVSRQSSSATVSSSDPNGISYTNTYKDKNGNWITKSDGTSIQNPNGSATIQNACMVEWNVVQSSVSSSGTVKGTEGNGPSTTFNSQIRSCDINNICPVDTTKGEFIKYDCGKLSSSLGEAASSLQVVSEMSKDLSCSTN